MKGFEKPAIYVRVSTEKLQDKGMESQKDALQDFIEGHELKNIQWFEDKMSGKTTKRPGLRALRHAIHRGRVKTVIVWKIDRLSRTLRDGINILADWLERDVRVICVAQPDFDFKGAQGQLIASLLLALAQIERENISTNVKRGLAKAKKNGVQLGKRPSFKTKDVHTLRNDGVPVTEIARRLKCTRQAIYKALATRDKK